MRSGIGLALCGWRGGELFAKIFGGRLSKNETEAALCTANAIASCDAGVLVTRNAVESDARVLLQSAGAVGQQEEARAHASWGVAITRVTPKWAVAARQWTPQLHPAMGESRSRRRSVTASMRLCIPFSVMYSGGDGRKTPLAISSGRALRLSRRLHIWPVRCKTCAMEKKSSQKPIIAARMRRMSTAARR
jgi:hypothetical protein